MTTPYDDESAAPELTDLPLEADEADAAEQAEPVDLDDDGRR